MTSPPDLLSRPPEEAARRIALDLLSEARAAATRLDDPADAEALHDFRVAIRRLRSTLRAWAPLLGKLAAKKRLKELRALQVATGSGRDAEVALEWLAGQRGELSPTHRVGFLWLETRLDAAHRRAMSDARSGVRAAFEVIEVPLRSGLQCMTLEVDLEAPDAGSCFAEALAERARETVQELALRLERVGSAEDREQAHRARIGCKRLRYLVEPARPHPIASSIVKRCKRLQDVLGDLNDAFVLREELGSAVETAAAERARRLHELATTTADEAVIRRETRRAERSGLLELTRRVQARVAERFARLQEDWLETGIHALVEEVEEFAGQLEQVGPGVEIERKYLLLGAPDFEFLEAAGVPIETQEIEQGWLPGDRLRERIRRVEREDGVRYLRTVKLGAGIERIEVEEATTERVYQALWPLTEGCRIRKRRFRIRDGSYVWEIDQFLDRELFLAEVELENASERPAFPSWLEDRVEREVTDDPRFTNLKMAR